jgi:hypothetical protein
MVVFPGVESQVDLGQRKCLFYHNLKYSLALKNSSSRKLPFAIRKKTGRKFETEKNKAETTTAVQGERVKLMDGYGTQLISKELQKKESVSLPSRHTVQHHTGCGLPLFSISL